MKIVHKNVVDIHAILFDYLRCSRIRRSETRHSSSTRLASALSLSLSSPRTGPVGLQSRSAASTSSIKNNSPLGCLILCTDKQLFGV